MQTNVNGTYQSLEAAIGDCNIPVIPTTLKSINASTTSATVFGYQVVHPQRYRVEEVDSDGVVRSLIEKPTRPVSNLAVTGLNNLDETASE